MNHRSKTRLFGPISGLAIVCALSGCASGHNLSLNSRVPQVNQTAAQTDTRTSFAQALGPTSDVLVADGNVLLPGSFPGSPTGNGSGQTGLAVAAVARGQNPAVQAALTSGRRASPPGLAARAAVGNGAAVRAAASANLAASPAGLAVGANANIPPGLAKQAPAVSATLGGSASGLAVGANANLPPGLVGQATTVSAGVGASASGLAVGANANLPPGLAGQAATVSGGAAAPASVSLTTGGGGPSGRANQPGVAASVLGNSVQASANPRALAAALPGSVSPADLAAAARPGLRLGGGR